MNVSSFQTSDYGDYGSWRWRENKANSKPFKANFKRPQQTEGYFGPLQPWPEQGRWLVCSCFSDEIWLIKHVQAFLDCISADRPYFFAGWPAVYCRM